MGGAYLVGMGPWIVTQPDQWTNALLTDMNFENNEFSVVGHYNLYSS